MRPPEFTGGNYPPERGPTQPDIRASMRPPEFTGGNNAAATVARRAWGVLQ